MNTLVYVHTQPHGSIATLSGIGVKETNVSLNSTNAVSVGMYVKLLLKLYLQIDQTKVSSIALATECDNLDEHELGGVAMSLEKSDDGLI